MDIVRTRVSLKGMRGTKDCIALVDTGAAISLTIATSPSNLCPVALTRDLLLSVYVTPTFSAKLLPMTVMVVEDEVLDTRR
jgi:hypothetical protein